MIPYQIQAFSDILEAEIVVGDRFVLFHTYPRGDIPQLELIYRFKDDRMIEVSSKAFGGI